MSTPRLIAAQRSTSAISFGSSSFVVNPFRLPLMAPSRHMLLDIGVRGNTHIACHVQ
jgi:hypothetical protein